MGATNKLDTVQVGFSRLISVAADGTGAIELGAHADSRDLGLSTSSGRIIDWLPDDPAHVIMEIYVPKRDTAGTLISNNYGESAQTIDVVTARLSMLQPAKPQVLAMDTDNHGTVRFMETGSQDADGYQRNNATLLVRAKGSSVWHNIGSTDLAGRKSIEYLGFDESGDKVLMSWDLNGRKALYTVDADGLGGQKLLFSHPQVDVDDVLRIGKFDRPVAASYVLDGEEHAYFDDVLDRRSKALSAALPGRPPVAILDESWDGRYNLIFGGGISDPGAYYRFDTKTKQLAALLPTRTDLAKYTTAKQTIISYKAADGTVIPGYLTLPPEGPTTGLPAIVMPHGGPSARDTLGFDWWVQFYAHLGYAVFQPNYRGSAGYGSDFFKKNGYKSWRTAIGDINDGARWLVAKGIANPAKLTAVGWSYGGYAVLQANVVEPKLYKAVIAVAPVTDLALMKAKYREFTNYILEREMVGEGDHVTQGSPAMHADQIEAPVLIFQGDKDTNVDLEQAKTMDAALASAHKKHLLVMYPGLDHHLADSAARADMLIKSANWLADAIGH